MPTGDHARRLPTDAASSRKTTFVSPDGSGERTLVVHAQRGSQSRQNGHYGVMSYEIAIRREDESEITRQEIEAFADFHIQDGITATNPETGEVMTLGGEFAVWTGHPELPDGVPFLYSRRYLKVSNPDDHVLARMRGLANALGARVQGDEGEYYDEDPPAERRGLFRRR